MIGLHCPVGIQSCGHWIELPGNCVWRWPHNPDLSLSGFHDKQIHGSYSCEDAIILYSMNRDLVSLPVQSFGTDKYFHVAVYATMLV